MLLRTFYIASHSRCARPSSVTDAPSFPILPTGCTWRYAPLDFSLSIATSLMQQQKGNCRNPPRGPIYRTPTNQRKGCGNFECHDAVTTPGWTVIGTGGSAASNYFCRERRLRVNMARMSEMFRPFKFKFEPPILHNFVPLDGTFVQVFDILNVRGRA